VLLVGGGSNLLVADEGFPGVAVTVRTTGVHVTRAGDDAVLVEVAAGEPWDPLVERTLAEGCSGLEALSGIPGSVGATPIQNVGAYGAEVSQVLHGLTVLDRRTGHVGALTPAGAGLGYRTSALKREPGRWVVLAVTYRLARDARSAPVRYAELAGCLGIGTGERAPAREVREAVLALRRGKGMVLDATDHDTWSAGSFFTNPVLPPEQAARLPESAPRFPQPDGSVKTSAAWLISTTGFSRGYALAPGAPASLSTKHVLALTNRGGATAADLLDLARAVRAGVQAHFAITLEPEPVLVGCAL
ncbi:MAG TPA: UDP-N-acetylmuramate dehydrogenase, partial [Candidatus Nanopelagicales bacterium]